MKARILSALLGMTALGGQAQAQIADWVDRIDAERLQGGEVHLGLYLNGEADGFMRLGWHLEGEILHFYDRSMLASSEIYETMEGAMNVEDFAPQNVQIRFHQQSTIFDFDVAFEGATISGAMSRTVPGQPVASRPIAGELPEGAIARAGFFVLSALAPLEVGQSIEFDWYAPMSQQVQSITVTAAEQVSIETPAGAFDTVRLEQRGGSPDNDVFVDIETGRIVRIDIGGMPMQFLALAAVE